MEYRYANILVVTLLVMTYGSGLPILYPIAALYFFTTYWVDKALIFYNYRKPLFFDEKLALHTQGYLKVAVLLHMIVGILMLSNSHILPVKKKAQSANYTDENAEYYMSTYTFGNMGTVHMKMFVGFIMTIAFLYFIWKVIVKRIL